MTAETRDVQSDIVALRRKIEEACKAFETLNPDFFLSVSYATIREHSITTLDGKARYKIPQAPARADIRATITDAP